MTFYFILEAQYKTGYPHLNRVAEIQKVEHRRPFTHTWPLIDT